ncbi:MAG: DUF2231 domain-containing protein [Methylococcaceae bacterium]|nr:DUF2231 domain-containing protein [Methylococcaceae bacterium]
MFDSNENLLFSVHGGGDDGGGMAGMLSVFLSAIEDLLSLSPSEILEHLLPGISAMENIHPLFVHFPIALLTLFFLIDFTGSVAKKKEWRQVAGWFLYLGAIFAGLTVTAGLMAAASVMHGDDVHEIMETHKHFGVSVFALATLLSIWRMAAMARLQGALNVLYLSCAGLMCVLLVFGADLGGLMVYKHGVAVEAARAAIAQGLDVRPHEHDHDQEHDHSH